MLPKLLGENEKVFGFEKREALKTRPADVYDATGPVEGALTGYPGGAAAGLVDGTRVATSKGWCPAEKVKVGDSVLTFDAGLKEVRCATRHALWTRAAPCPRKFWPLLVPAGAVGNIDEMLLLPDQAVMIECETAEMIHGDRFMLIPASALVGWRGIRRVIPCKPVQVITLQFDSEQIVLANVGLQFLCSAAPAGLNGALVARQPAASQVLPMKQALALVQFLAFEDVESGAATRGAVPTSGIYAAFAA